MMRLKEKQRLDRAVKVMKTLNKMQKQTKELRKNLDKKSEVIEEYNIKELETKIFECSLMPVNLIAFLELVERTKGKVLGIKIEDNNLEVFFKPNILNVKAGRGGKV